VSTPQGRDPNALYRPPSRTADDDTTVLAPITDGTGVLHRIPLPERKRWQIVVAALAALLLVSTGFTIYLWIVSDRWAARADVLDAQAHDIGERLSTEQNYVVQQTEQIDILTQQLTTLQQKVGDLAAQTAQQGDAVAYAQQQVQYLNELVSLGGSVSLALNRCVNEQKTLQDYLKNSDAYSPEDIASFEDSVTKLCSAAQDANAQLQQELAN
jgi:hypothetical protein